MPRNPSMAGRWVNGERAEAESDRERCAKARVSWFVNDTNVPDLDRNLWVAKTTRRSAHRDHGSWPLESQHAQERSFALRARVFVGRTGRDLARNGYRA